MSITPYSSTILEPWIMSTKKKIHFITGNAGKLAEVNAILGPVVDLTNTNVDLIEIQGTVEEVTIDKCRRAADAVGADIIYLALTSSVLSVCPNYLFFAPNHNT